MITDLVLTLAWCMLERSTNESTVEPKRCLFLDVCTSSLEADLHEPGKSWRVSVLASRVVSTELISPRLYVFRKFQCSEWKPIVTLAHDLHQPQSVKRGVVRCLYDLAKHLTTKPSAISEEKKHLSSVLVSNGYPSSFVRKLAKTTRITANKEPAQEFNSITILPYLKGVSEFLRRCLQHQGIRTVFKSDTTLRSHLVRPKDA